MINKLITFTVLALWCVSASAGDIPESAEKYMARGDAALETAKDADGYKKAITEYEAAAKEAPNWPDPFYNLGMVYPKVENYEAAIRNFNRYLVLSPNSKDAKAVKKEIYSLEYKLEGQEKTKGLFGTWSCPGEGSESISLFLQGSGSHAKIEIHSLIEYYVVEIPDVEINDGKFMTSEGNLKNLVDSCTMNLQQIKGSINPQGDLMDIELTYTLGHGYVEPGRKIVRNNTFTKTNWIGLIPAFSSNIFAGVYYTKKLYDVVPGTLAGNAGLKKDDEILSINGKDYKPMTPAALDMFINTLPKDSPVTVKVDRDGVDKPIDFTFKRP